MQLREKKRKHWRASLTYKKMIRDQNENLKLKDMAKLGLHDEAFHLPVREMFYIFQFILTRRTPTRRTYQRWDKYAISFYLKMCTCFGVDYQHLEGEDTTTDNLFPRRHCIREKHVIPKAFRSVVKQEDLPGTTEIINLEKQLRQKRRKFKPMSYGHEPTYLRAPFKLGSYSPGTEPDRIPYPLYLLVKEAVDIINNHPTDLIDLKIVEKKIRFFCTYFNSHLPTSWKYKRANASSLIDGYDAMGGYRCLMAGYTPFGGWAEAKGCDRKSGLYPREIVDVMSIIHSRKTPVFRGMPFRMIAFYCKLCSCFGIEYHRLEAACKEKVCLMSVG